mmetsp:Transcript_10581/g.20532  ORF Transcript_10581/g.20532 Transcript_10581/m.20532 type:complete len:258 (+) Transcript_10581:1333-2106(+)
MLWREIYLGHRRLSGDPQSGQNLDSLRVFVRDSVLEGVHQTTCLVNQEGPSLLLHCLCILWLHRRHIVSLHDIRQLSDALLQLCKGSEGVQQQLEEVVVVKFHRDSDVLQQTHRLVSDSVGVHKEGGGPKRPRLLHHEPSLLWLPHSHQHNVHLRHRIVVHQVLQFINFFGILPAEGSAHMAKENHEGCALSLDVTVQHVSHKRGRSVIDCVQRLVPESLHNRGVRIQNLGRFVGKVGHTQGGGFPSRIRSLPPSTR